MKGRSRIMLASIVHFSIILQELNFIQAQFQLFTCCLCVCATRSSMIVIVHTWLCCRHQQSECSALVPYVPSPLQGMHARTLVYQFPAMDLTIDLAQRFGEEGIGVGGAAWPAGYIVSSLMSRILASNMFLRWFSDCSDVNSTMPCSPRFPSAPQHQSIFMTSWRGTTRSSLHLDLL